jgi:hypothetical protein
VSRRTVPAGPAADPPLYPRKGAPPSPAARSRLRATGLRPGRQGVQALVVWRSRVDGLRCAGLSAVGLARPRITLTSAHAAALAAAMAARRTCPRCSTGRGPVPSARPGKCNDCAAAAGEL